MTLQTDSLGYYNKHKDDPVFMEYLLNNHSEIVDSKDGSNKILFSMEISRLLARTAVHERCQASDNNRPMDEEKYLSYHKTALYVARRGIDIGIDMAYDAHEGGTDIPDFAYNHNMAWLYVQYSMMLTETHRYFAAMTAITHAEVFVVHDVYTLGDDERLKALVKELKTIPEFENVSFNFSAKQLRPRLEEMLKKLYNDLWEAVYEKKLRILFKIYKEVPQRYRELYVISI